MKTVQVYWTAFVTRSFPHLTRAIMAFIGMRTAPDHKRAARRPHSVCSGSLEAFSFDADYRFNLHFDAYRRHVQRCTTDGQQLPQYDQHQPHH
jgi:hypothetical protein